MKNSQWVNNNYNNKDRPEYWEESWRLTVYSKSSKKPSANAGVKNSQKSIIIILIIKRTCRIVDFAVPANHCVKLRESEKKDK